MRTDRIFSPVTAAVAALLFASGCVAPEHDEDAWASPASTGSPDQVADVPTDDSEQSAGDGWLSLLGADAGHGMGMPKPTGEVSAPQMVPEDEEGGDYVIAPIPFANPTIGAGLALGGAYFLELDPDGHAAVCTICGFRRPLN